MTKVLILDVYPNKPFRISKDQNGGYGTANDYGDSFVLKILNNYVKKNIDYPPLYSVYPAGQLRANGFEVEYSKTLNNKTNFDLYVLPSSIVCHETEVENVKKLNKLGKKIFIIVLYLHQPKILYGSINFVINIFCGILSPFIWNNILFTRNTL